eukprot:TRINITY_DN316_c0_g1_i9.p2 TRINITY_DN316_c0_g1~~TRINITY_DN316_c0_g1_i9.p2  ORF type:complete len:143 (+),score=19.48 TRINITY_DN316_c0_g1_i9:352-780(+)
MVRPLTVALAAVAAAAAATTAAATALPSTVRADDAAAWNYTGPTGPEFWHELDDRYAVCQAGERQSPIDLILTPRSTLTRRLLPSSARGRPPSPHARRSTTSRLSAQRNSVGGCSGGSTPTPWSMCTRTRRRSTRSTARRTR